MAIATCRIPATLLILTLLLTCQSTRKAEAANKQYSASCEAQAHEDLKDDCTALESLYDATGGDSWRNKTNWKTTAQLDDWNGVTVTDGRVSIIFLGNNNLRGTIPGLSALGELKELRLYWNNLSGAIPDLSGLAKLTHLHLGGNRLSEPITPSYLPTSLKRLELYQNRLTGTIPDLSGLKNIEIIHLGGNRLSGEIPDLSKLDNLTGLHLYDNRLSEPITPSHLPASLEWLHLAHNSLSGEIPDLSRLNNLQRLHLFETNLSGEIPDLRALAELTELHLNNNYLSGTIEPSYLPASLQFLDLSGNRLDGEIPELSALTNLKDIHLGDNELSGTIPDFTSSTYLYALDLSANRLSGVINPSNLPKKWLQILNLSGNNLSGEIPNLSSFSSLSWLILSNNSLTGIINPSNLPRLAILVLHGNNLSGGIPDLRASNSNLLFLYLHNNALTGGIPVSNLPKKLLRLYLHNNNLTGSGNDLSPDLSKLTELQELALWGNTDPTGDVILTSPVTSSVIDKAALRFLHDANGGPDWSNRTRWLLAAPPLGRWHGVTTENSDGSGRVIGLNLTGNGLKNGISNSIEALSALTALQLAYNEELSGTLPERLADISGLSHVDIRCTRVGTPLAHNFIAWVSRLGSGFKSGCEPPTAPARQPEPEPEPEPPMPISPDGSVLIAETEDDVFAFTPVGEGGRVIYGEKTIDFTVTGNDDLSPNPTIILSRAVLDAIADAGGSVTFDVSADLSEDPPSGFRLGGLVVDIGLGVDDAGETVGVCLPVDGGVEDPVVHHYDEEPGAWEPLAEQETSGLNGVRSVCGKTDAFSRFGLFVAEEDPVPPEPEPEPEPRPEPELSDGCGGCAISGTGSTVQGTAFSLLMVFAVLCAVAFRSRAR